MFDSRPPGAFSVRRIERHDVRRARPAWPPVQLTLRVSLSCSVVNLALRR